VFILLCTGKAEITAFLSTSAEVAKPWAVVRTKLLSERQKRRRKWKELCFYHWPCVHAVHASSTRVLFISSSVNANTLDDANFDMCDSIVGYLQF